MEERKGLYVISVAARLVEAHPRTLRIYEEEGLIKPVRSDGNIRLYCEHDIKKIKYIRFLTQEKGVNLAGVKMIMQMKNEIEKMKGEDDDG